MKLHLVTVGKPKLAYAKLGWDEYLPRLQRMHQVDVRTIPDKYAYDAVRIMVELQGTTLVALEITGTEFTSEQLASQLTKFELESRPVSFLVGGPEGLPEEVRKAAQITWSIGRQTLPHDLAALVMLEALYRASTINAGLPYHK